MFNSIIEGVIGTLNKRNPEKPILEKSRDGRPAILSIPKDRPKKFNPEGKEINLNEDSSATLEIGGVTIGSVVTDGVSMSFYGREAAQITANSVKEELKKMYSVTMPDDPDDIIENRLRMVVDQAHQSVLSYRTSIGLETGDMDNPRYDTMTTASIVYVHERRDGSRVAFIANVGDSRVYTFNTQRKELQLQTIDHLAILAGKTPQEQRDLLDLFSRIKTNADLARLSLNLQQMYKATNMISQGIGVPVSPPEPFITKAELPAKTRLMLCTDGQSDNQTSPEMSEILGKSENQFDAVNNLVAAARKVQLLPVKDGLNDRKQIKPDDVTTIVVDYKEAIRSSGLRIGDRVAVQRSAGSGGQFESDWVIFDFDNDGSAIVVRDRAYATGNSTDRKVFPKELLPMLELRKINERQLIQSANSITELTQIIQKLGYITGSLSNDERKTIPYDQSFAKGKYTKWFDSADLINQIMDYARDTILDPQKLSTIPNTHDLQRKVFELRTSRKF